MELAKGGRNLKIKHTFSNNRHGHICTVASLCECGDGVPDSTTIIMLESLRFDFSGGEVYIREPLSASNVHTLMGLLASMGPNMDSESTPLNETFSTPGGHARIRALVGVNSIMSLKI